MKIEFLSGSQYFLLFIDGYSHFNWVYFLKYKSETFENFKKFKAFADNQSGKKLKALCTGKGDEFLSNKYIAFCDENKIHRELTIPYTPKQNGVAEWKNRTMEEMAKSLFKAQSLPNYFWGEAIAIAIYLLNISLTKAALNKTPFEGWRGKKPQVRHLKIFGCIAYGLVNIHSKPDEKSQKIHFH